MKILLVCVWGGTQEQKEQAKRLSQAAGQIPTPPPVFEAIKEIGTVVPTVKLQDLASSHLDSPFVLEADSVKTALDQWLGDKNTQAVIASWAAKYKKNDVFLSKKKLIESIQSEPTEALFKKFLSNVNSNLVDVSRMCKNWNKVSYLQALDVNGWYCGVTPSCSAMLRYQFMGELDVHLFDMNALSGDLCKASTAAGTEVQSLKKLKENFLDKDGNANEIIKSVRSLRRTQVTTKSNCLGGAVGGVRVRASCRSRLGVL